jgi:CheY-like chemotaxis protein
MAYRETKGLRPNGSRRSALVVASDATSGALCRSALEAGDWQVVAADSGVAAVVEARRAVPAVIFIELQLRDVPGREALGWLRSNPDLGGVPVVLIAGGADDDEEIERIAPDGLLRRPLTRQAVARIVSGLAYRPV